MKVKYPSTIKDASIKNKNTFNNLCNKHIIFNNKYILCNRIQNGNDNMLHNIIILNSILNFKNKHYIREK